MVLLDGWMKTGKLGRKQDCICVQDANFILVVWRLYCPKLQGVWYVALSGRCSEAYALQAYAHHRPATGVGYVMRNFGAFPCSFGTVQLYNAKY
jgi:hypothetical protein